ncbi:MAG TPA: hypothetical protein VK040_07220 [Balneolaceae bacterium]|nr:hypothetical protein [Balneolaceae bacterium]
MAAWIWILIPLVAIIGGYIIDYQKNKLKWRSATASSESELEELRAVVTGLRKRIENLEAIAANLDAWPEEEASGRITDSWAELDPDQIKKENERIVSEKVKSGGR